MSKETVVPNFNVIQKPGLRDLQAWNRIWGDEVSEEALLVPKIPRSCSWHSVHFLGSLKGALLYAHVNLDDDIKWRIRDFWREAVKVYFQEQSYRLSRKRIANRASAVTSLRLEGTLNTHGT